MSIENDLTNSGIPYPLAAEMVATFNGATTSPLRLSALGVSGTLAIELSRQLNGGAPNVMWLITLGLPPGVAAYIISILLGSDYPSVPDGFFLIVDDDQIYTETNDASFFLVAA